MASAPRIHTVLFVLSLLVTWVVWGSSFVAITWALEALPPLLLMGSRFVAAGLVACAAGAWLAHRRGTALPSLVAWRDASLVGLGFITVGMGATGWAATRLPTGVAALLVASAPVWIAVMQLLLPGTDGRSRLALGGILVGIAGVAVLVAPGGGPGIDPLAAGVLVLANAAWAASSLYSPRSADAGSLVMGVGMQMLTGGALLALVALAWGEGSRLQLSELGVAAGGGWIYLVLAGSIGGFLCYGWLLDHVSASTASTHAFVNPLVAVALGALLLGEQVGPRMLVAGAAVVVAVVLLLLGEARSTAPSTATAVAPAAAPTARTSQPRTIGARPRRARWSPAPTPAFAARRAPRPWHATDGMDALAIDEALDGPTR